MQADSRGLWALIWLMCAFCTLKYNRNVHGLFVTLSVPVNLYCVLIRALELIFSRPTQEQTILLWLGTEPQK